LHRPIENEKNSVYCDANVDISHVAPRGTESDANYFATSIPHGRTRRNKQGHAKGVFFLLDKHKKNCVQLCMKGEDIKGEYKSAALTPAHLISIAKLFIPGLIRALKKILIS
jgi:hypothetical protein